MANNYFQFKQFTVYQDRCAMKVTTDGCVFGAWMAESLIVPAKRDQSSMIVKGETLEVKEEDEMSSVFNNKGRMRRVLEIGTGTGVLALMIAQKNEDVMIDAVEIDKESAVQARENVEASIWKDRIRVINEDILEFKSEELYDCIVSNPPFYEKEIRSENDKKNTAHHSEQLTLEEVLDIIKKHLKDNGRFYLLLPGKREKEMEKMMEKKELLVKKKVILHLSKTNRRIMIEGRGILNKEQGRGILNKEQGMKNNEGERIMNIEQGILNKEVENEEIWVGEGRFRELMKDYYLKG